MDLGSTQFEADALEEVVLGKDLLVSRQLTFVSYQFESGV